MVFAASSVTPDSPRPFTIIPIISVLLLASITTGCGSSAPTPPKLSGNTSVTVLLSSTANDQLQQFGIGLQTIALTNQSGKTVSLFSTPQGTESWAEFIHLNGAIEPFVTVSVPQDIYTAAVVTVAQSDFTCVTLTPSGGLDTSFYGYGTNPSNAPTTTVTVTQASPITVTGDSMGLVFDLQVAQSATYGSCYSQGINPYSITPAFNLSPISFATGPTNPQNGKVSQLEGEVTATTASGLTLTLPDGQRTLSIGVSSSTIYQGISGLPTLSAGMFVDMDGAIQSDGSVLASRLAVLDPSATDVQIGPVMIVGGDPENPGTAGFFFNRSSQGADPIPGNWAYNFTNASFQISGQLTNLSSLPFVPSFSVSNIVAGQNVYVSTNQFQVPTDPYSLASRVTLMPQTINGTVTGTSQVGNFTDYTVSLAPYDLFPQLSVQQGQTTLLSNASNVEVYVDESTQKLNTQALAAGSMLRFYGLVFNDNGTLRMDCAEVNDGVTATSTGSSTGHAQGRLEVHRAGLGIVQRITTTK